MTIYSMNRQKEDKKMKEKALLVGVELPNLLYPLAYSLDELAKLAYACELEVCGQITQKLASVNPRYFIGKGKVAQIKEYCLEHEIDIIIFDDELSPGQIKNLEQELDISIIDRSFLILQIFAKRAHTLEAILEVELAQLKYLLPRLSGLHENLSRQGGNSGSFSAKGPGEKQIELDRRKILKSISVLQKKIEAANNTRLNQKAKRVKMDIPLIALAGYTNAGKSSTMNTILESTQSNKLVEAKDMLFATLDTSIRKIKLANNQEFLLLDTVGFVSKLPHHLVKSFQSTLSEILETSLIIHVIDVSNEFIEQQIDVTLSVLKSIGAGDIPQLYLLNKADMLPDPENPPLFLNDYLIFSNKNKSNLDKLLKYISDFTREEYYTLKTLFIPLTEGKTINTIETVCIINSKVLQEDGYIYNCHIPNYKITELIKYSI